MRIRATSRRRAVLLAVATTLIAAPAASASEKYVVLYKTNAVPSDAARAISGAGGSVVASYQDIGVVIAQSDSSGFAAAVSRDNRVEGAASTAGLGTRIEQPADDGSNLGEMPNAPATDGDTLSPLQWDMRQIHTPEAHAITGGSPAVVVGDIDTGLDKDHPDLQQNIDYSRSVSCESGAPNQDPNAWDDHNGHGTHTAGTIAAASNGIGVVGVAPNVKLAAIKSSNNDGFFFPEMVVCAFMWAGSHQIDVTNNSYFVDPYLFNCRNDAGQRAIWKAVQRAVQYAQNHGVTVVAAEGNESEDLSHPGVDAISPDYPPGNEQQRDVTNACVVLPVELPGVIGVTSVGHNQQTDDEPGADYLKSFYSTYGISTADVTAPGGDSVFGANAEAPNGRVLSTYPAELPCSRRVLDATTTPSTTYCYLQGTSMASPHVAGVAALIVSRYGDLSNPRNGKMRPGAVEAMLQQTADPQPCPTALPAGYQDAQRPAGGGDQTCQGGSGHTSWYGAGQVNALTAISR